MNLSVYASDSCSGDPGLRRALFRIWTYSRFVVSGVGLVASPECHPDNDRPSSPAWVPGALLVLVGCQFALGWFVMMRVPVNPDAGYYVPVALEVMHGATPTVDVTSAYTPLFYYLAALWMTVAGATFASVSGLVFLLHLLNTTLVGLLSYRFQKDGPLASHCCLAVCYFSCLFGLGGACVVLEPLQMVFVLLALYLTELRHESFWKDVGIGVCLGLSVMAKQYSLVFVPALLAYRCIRGYGEVPLRTLLSRQVVAGLAVILPYIMFVLCTEATLHGSLSSFGFIGSVGADYYGLFSAGKRAGMLLRALEQYHWLAVPAVLVIWVSARGTAESTRRHLGLVLLLGASALPATVRSFSHYFQLVAPWSVLLFGEAVVHLTGPQPRRPALWAIAIGAFLFVLLACSWNSASAYWLHRVTRLLILLTTGSVFAVALAARLSGQVWRARNRCLRLISIVLSAYLVLWCCWWPSRLFVGTAGAASRQRQTQTAAALNRIFPRGTEVQVVHGGELYLTCGWRSPFHNYSFLWRWWKRGEVTDPGKINAVVIPRRRVSRSTADTVVQWLLRNGLRQKEVPESISDDYILFCRE